MENITIEKVVSSRLKATDIDIVRGLSNGKSAIEVAERLGRPVKSLQGRLYQLRKKFGCNTTTQLVASFIRSKIIE